MKIIALLIMLISVIVGLSLLGVPSQQQPITEAELTTPSLLANNKVAAAAPIAAKEAERVALMKAQYQVLAQSRTQLKKRLARLKHRLWQQKFPPADAEEIRTTLLNAYKLIKNPPLLGAFSDVAEIEAEHERIVFADKSLDTIDTLIASRASEHSPLERDRN